MGISKFLLYLRIFFTMKFFALFALVAVAAAFDQAWEDYKLEFDKHYTPEEEAMRYANWKKDSEEVLLHNAMFGHEFTQAVNFLSDLTDEEYKQQYFDCSGRYGNYGCRGGWYQSCWRYAMSAGGNMSESAYRYTARQGRCRFNRGQVVATVRSFHDTQPGNENDLTNALARVGPVSVAIDASPRSFMRYRSGVHWAPGCSSSRLSHAVLAVGYGSERGRDYYLVKNSWGTRWGAGGYIKMIRNRNNNCGIATKPSYPIV